MAELPESTVPDETVDPVGPPWRSPATVQALAYVLVAGAAAWYLLQVLAPVVRPLLTAAFLTYVLLPYHSRLRKEVSAPVSIVVLAGATAALLVSVGLAVYSSVIGLNEEIPGLQQRAVALAHRADEWVTDNAPWVYPAGAGDGKQAEARLAERAAQAARPFLNATAEALLEASVVGLYLVFLLLEASRFPDRVRKAYAPGRAEEILHVAGQVNAAIVSYLRAKVQASLILALPVGLVLWAFGVRFAFLWAVLTFLCNFIPYLGSVVAFGLPAGFAFLQFDPGWRPVGVAVALLACHAGSASVVEPMLLGRAVGLSPLVILGSLGFWGLMWGVPGMFLAVPLTAVAVIVMGHFRFTRPVARLLGG